MSAFLVTHEELEAFKREARAGVRAELAALTEERDALLRQVERLCAEHDLLRMQLRDETARCELARREALGLRDQVVDWQRECVDRDQQIARMEARR